MNVRTHIKIHIMMMKVKDSLWIVFIYKIYLFYLNTENQLYCPYRFDGYVCWPRTIAGTTVYQKCPDFVTGFSNRLLAHKECHQNGTWYTHPETGMEWSNYTTCVDVGDFEVK